MIRARGSKYVQWGVLLLGIMAAAGVMITVYLATHWELLQNKSLVRMLAELWPR